MPGFTQHEQRKHRRLSLETPLRFEVLNAMGEAGKPVHSLTNNISCGGLAFMSPVSIPVRTRLRFEMSLPGEAHEIAAIGHIVRVIGAEIAQDGFEYGVEFEQVTAPEKLAHFVGAMDIIPLLSGLTAGGASVIHLTAGGAPMIRIGRALTPSDIAPLSREALESMLRSVLTIAQRRQLDAARHIDFTLDARGEGRWRAALYYHSGALDGVFRAVHAAAPTLEELGLPDVARAFLRDARGLVLVVGPPASGKSATLSALTAIINDNTSGVIISIEDPVECLHVNQRAIVKQREVGTDVASMAEGLRQALALDPDVLVIGEAADAETLALLLCAAEMPCLTLAAISTSTAVEALNRIALAYPREQRAVALHILASTLRGVITQRLLPSSDGGRMVLAAEVMLPNEQIQHLIRSGQIEHIPPQIASVPGAIPLETCLKNLVVRGLINKETAAQAAR